MNIRKIAALAAAAAVALSCGCSGKKGRRRADVPERPTDWSVEQRSIDDITPNEGETQVFINRDEEDDTIRIIQGVLSPESINDENDALDLIASYSAELDYIDVYSELSFSGTMSYGDKVEYRFDQYCDGMKVLDSYVNLTVDHNIGNKAVVLENRYTDTWGFSTKPKVSVMEAVQCAGAKFKADKSVKPELVIFRGPVLAWKVAVKDSSVYEVYIDANNGDIIYEQRTEG